MTIDQILTRFRDVRVAVYGDFCLDAYWTLDARGSEVSVETGLQADAVGSQAYSLGGASNIVANLAALQPASIHVVGAVGADLFRAELLQLMQELGVDTSRMVVQRESFDTMTYCKRILEGEEQARLDFGIYNRRSRATDDQIIGGLRELVDDVDVVILNQQVPGSIPNPEFCDAMNALVSENPDRIFILDTRHYGSAFRGVLRKTNDFEAAILNGLDATPQDVFSLDDVRRFAHALHQKEGKPIFLSRGDRGMLVADGDQVHDVPGIQIMGKTDAVGAGDTALSAIACCLAAGVSTVDAARVANFAASVTVQKLHQTGTASPEEIRNAAQSADYIYAPELAEDIRRARIEEGTDIEICCSREQLGATRIRHAVFDHDGTISALREGWEAVMEPMMIHAVLGTRYADAEEGLYLKVRTRVLDYIDKSTGIQTILQMEGLVEMVCEFGVVPDAEVLDATGYKAIYNETLLDMVRVRIARLKRGALGVDDYLIKGAVEFLRALRELDVTLYLASGTDREDVIGEAQTLGYAELFNGGMHGAVGDVSKYSKKMVIDKILKENHLEGDELAVFGDGPVEIRECRKVNGIAVGIASDEIRRHGLSTQKRTRLIKAGASLIAPDFSDRDALLGFLFG